MKYNEKKPPREFKVGVQRVTLRDCGSLDLDSDEQVTFLTSDKKEYDVVRKDWGFYATPSLNKRLVRFSWRPALAVSAGGSYYLLLVEERRQRQFKKYCRSEGLIYYWLTDEMLKKIEKALGKQTSA